MAEIQQTWTTEIKPTEKLLSVDFKEIWRYRDLMMLFVKRKFSSIPVLMIATIFLTQVSMMSIK